MRNNFKYLITSVSSLTVNIAGDVHLAPQYDADERVSSTSDEDQSSVEHIRGVMSRAHRAAGVPVMHRSIEWYHASPRAAGRRTANRTSPKKSKRTHQPLSTTTAYTTKYERGTTRRHRQIFRAHHHKKHKRTHVKQVAFTIPQWPQMPLLTIHPDDRTTTQSTKKSTGKNDISNHAHHHKPIAQNWMGQLKNKTGDLNSMINQFSNQSNQIQQYINNKTNIGGLINQFGDHIDKWAGNKTKEIGDLANKWQNDIKNTTINNFQDKINEYNKDVQNWQEIMKNKTQQELGGKINEFGDQANKWIQGAKNKSQQIGDKVQEIGNEANKIQEQAIDKQKELSNKFSNLTNQFGNEASKWQDQAKDTQKELEDKYKDVGNQANQIKEKLPFLDQTSGFADTWKQQVGEMGKDRNSVHKIRDDLPLNAFAKHVLVDTLNLFDRVKHNSTEHPWKKNIKRMAKNYENKFKEFIRITGHQRIKTRLGVQKVILNAIDMSQYIVSRLVNLTVNDIDKKGMLRVSRTQDVIYSEINKVVNSQLQYACRNLGVCVTHNTLMQTIMDVLSNLIVLATDKFKQAFDALTEAAKSVDLSRTLGRHNDQHFKSVISNIEGQDTNVQRSLVMIIKNILANRNKPLVVTTDTDAKESHLNQTLAFLEIIDTLDKNVADTDDNMKRMNEIKIHLNGWTKGYNIQYTMTKFVLLIKKVIDEVNGNAYKVIRHNFNILFS